MSTYKNKITKVTLIAIAVIICLGILTVAVGALQNTPYHTHSSGLKLKSESHFCGNVPGTGKYKTIKGKYIKRAWVQINEGGNKKAYKASKTVSKKSSDITFASTSCSNNPLKSQTFPYGWNYQ